MNIFDLVFNFGTHPSVKTKAPLPDVDQFPATEFFFDEHGLMLTDVAVFARAQSNPELQEKIKSYMIEQDIKAFDASTSDEDVFSSIQTKYDSTQSILDRVKARIVELRSQPKEEKQEGLS